MHCTLAVAHQSNQFVGAQRGVGAQYHNGFDGFAPLLVRHADDGGGSHSGMRGDDILNFPWVDVESAGDDQIFLAINDMVVAVRIAISQIAGVQPAVAQGARGFFGCFQ